MATLARTQTSRPVTLFIRGAEIHAELTVPEDARGLIVFANPCGSSRANPKHQHVAGVLNDAGLATLFCDLLTSEEELLSNMTGEFRHDVALLSLRLTVITDWCRGLPTLAALPIGYLGVGAGAATAFMSAAQRSHLVRAIVVRGGRLDLAWTSLKQVQAPVLLVAGEHDEALRDAYTVCLPHIGATDKEVVIVPRAGQMFCEPTALDQFAEHAARWFAKHLPLEEEELAWSAAG